MIIPEYRRKEIADEFGLIYDEYQQGLYFKWIPGCGHNADFQVASLRRHEADGQTWVNVYPEVLVFDDEIHTSSHADFAYTEEELIELLYEFQKNYKAVNVKSKIEEILNARGKYDA